MQHEAELSEDEWEAKESQDLKGPGSGEKQELRAACRCRRLRRREGHIAEDRSLQVRDLDPSIALVPDRE